MAYAVGEYYERVNDYDLEYESQSEQDLPFWRELVKRLAPHHVLELACGSGRIGMEILQSFPNLRLEGLDVSTGMLNAYKRKLAQAGPSFQERTTLHEGTMTSYSLPSQGLFDLIILPFNSISHLYDLNDQLSTFHATFQHLAPGGFFVVDTFLPDLDYLSSALNRPSQVYLEDELTSPNEDFTMLMYSSRKYDPISQIQHLSWIHEKFFTSGENERYHTNLDMQVFFPRELQLLFLATGFSIDSIYGDYLFKPLGRGSRQIVIAQKGR